MSQVKKSSSGDSHPYLKISFWTNPTNQFWESSMYTEEGKQYYRDSVQSMIKDDRRMYNKKHEV